MTAHLSKGCLLLFYMRGYHRDINKSCTYRILSVSAIEKEIQEKSLVSFFYALRPTGSRGCSTDRCRWQKKEGDAGEKSGVPRTERREGERTTRFRGGQGRFKSCLRNRKRGTREKEIQEKILYLFLCPATDGFFTDLGIGKKKLNRDDWRPAHLQYEGYYQAGQHQGV